MGLKVRVQLWASVPCIPRAVDVLDEQPTGVKEAQASLPKPAMQDELYSSRVKDFEVYGRQSHPRAEGSDYGAHLNASAWQLLSRFTAANTKGTQV